MQYAASQVCAEAGLYYFQVRVFHKQFDEVFHGAGHTFALQRMENNQGAVFFDWRGGIYQLAEENLTQALLEMLRNNLRHYSIGNTGSPETIVINKMKITESAVKAVKQRFDLQ